MVRGKQARAEVEAMKEAEAVSLVQDAIRTAITIADPSGQAGTNMQLVLVVGSAEEKPDFCEALAAKIGGSVLSVQQLILDAS
eukprot:1247319-Prymnesium_polylepis.1